MVKPPGVFRRSPGGSLKNEMDKSRKILIGFDPSFNNCGIAIRREDGALILHTDDLANVFTWLNERYKPNELLAVVEDPGAINVLFGGWSKMRNAINSKNTAIMKNVFMGSIRAAMNVGSNAAAARLIKDMLRQSLIPVITVSPQDRQRADKTNAPIELLQLPTKTNKKQFKKLTGYTGKSSEHSRDAATLIYNMTPAQFHTKLKIKTA